MRIVSIFAEKLFAFHFENEAENELKRLLDLWNDTLHISDFLEEHKLDIPTNEDINTLSFKLLEFANEIDDTLIELANDNSLQLEQFFAPLHNEEFLEVTLSRQKGRNSYLRIYALKIDQNCFVITGGAIKLTQTMQEREHTIIELQKINRCRDYLRDNGVSDVESFYEFLSEQK